MDINVDAKTAQRSSIRYVMTVHIDWTSLTYTVPVVVSLWRKGKQAYGVHSWKIMRIPNHRRRIPLPWLLPLVLLAISSATTADESSHNSATTGSNDNDLASQCQCRLWVAPSSIPGAGLGVFNGYREIGEGEASVDVDQIIIPFVGMEFHNGEFEGISNSAKASNWRNHLINFLHSAAAFGFHFPPTDAGLMVAGTGSLLCSHFFLQNVEDSTTAIEFDTLTMHRTTDPGVGAFSSSHGYEMDAVKVIPPFAEIFTNYGEQWFRDRTDSVGAVPLPDDWKSAQEFLDLFQSLYWKNTKTAFVYNDAVLEIVWTLLFEQLEKDVDENDARLEKVFQEQFTADDSTRRKAWNMISNLLENAITFKEAVVRALPRAWEDAKFAMEHGLEELARVKSIRTLEWLQNHGRCMDGLLPGNSSIPQAGRGALARRGVAKGDVVTHSPLLHITDRSMLRVYYMDDPESDVVKRNLDDPWTWQLMLNYCFGRNDTSLLLCPYGSTTPHINHHSTDYNVKIIWATNVSWFDPSCLRMTPRRMAYHYRTCLAIDYVATRDIKEGEEILLDYGRAWQQAWDKHVETWRPDPEHATLHPKYVRASDMNRDMTAPIRTHQEEEEEDGDSYSPNLSFECRHPGFDVWYPCSILQRKEKGDPPEYVYAVEVYYTTTSEENEEGTEDSVSISGLARKDIRFVENGYFGDEFLPNAFRHEMHFPDELFSKHWITNEDTKNPKEKDVTNNRSRSPATCSKGEDGECRW